MQGLKTEVVNTGISMKEMTITPVMAEQWLSIKNLEIRNISTPTVAKYEDDMRSGRWEMNGETIILATDGHVIDGNHRLMACLRSGCNFRSIVVRGVEPAKVSTIDIGRARSAADNLKMMGYKNAPMLAAVSRIRLGLLAAGKLTGGGSILSSIPNRAVIDNAVDNNDLYQQALLAATSIAVHLKGKRSVWAGVWIQLGDMDEEDRDFFFAQLASDKGHVPGDPILALRRFFLNRIRDGNTPSNEEQAAVTIKTWNKFRRHETAEVASYKGNEDYPTVI